MRNLRSLLLLVSTLGSAACVTGRYAVSPYGRRVEVVPVSGAANSSVSGELIAVSADSVWVLAHLGLVTMPLTQVDAVRVARHGFTAGKALLWSAVAGTISGVALTAACGAAGEGSDCAGVFPSVLVSWGIVGGIAAATVSGSAHQRLGRTEWEQLRPYARFPQGIPEQFPRTP